MNNRRSPAMPPFKAKLPPPPAPPMRNIRDDGSFLMVQVMIFGSAALLLIAAFEVFL